MPRTIYRCKVCKATPQYKNTGLPQDKQGFDIHAFIKAHEDAAVSEARAKGTVPTRAKREATGRAIQAVEEWGKREVAYDAAKKKLDEAKAATKKATTTYDGCKVIDRSEGPNPAAVLEAAKARTELLRCQDEEATLQEDFDTKKAAFLAALHNARARTVINPLEEKGNWPCEKCGTRSYDVIVEQRTLRPIRVARGRTRPRSRPVQAVDRSERPTKISFAVYSGSYYSMDPSKVADRPKMLEDALTKVTSEDTLLGDATSTLNVFLCPEFFFTEMGGDTALWYISMDQKKDVFEKLATISGKFPDWVIAPGTVCWIDDEHEEKGVYNATPIFFGGELLHVHCKKTLPGGELDPCASSDLIGKTIYSEQDEEGAWSDEKNINGVFHLKGVTFGVEICNDYRCGIFKNTYKYVHRSTPPIDVFIFPGAGIILNGGIESYSEEIRPMTGDSGTTWPPSWITDKPTAIGHRNIRLRQGGYLVHSDANKGELIGAKEEEGDEEAKAAIKLANEGLMRTHSAVNNFVARKDGTTEESVALNQDLGSQAFCWLGKRGDDPVYHYVATWKDQVLPAFKLVD